MLRETTAARDFSAQEVMHHLFSFETIKKSRTTVAVAVDDTREVDPIS